MSFIEQFATQVKQAYDGQNQSLFSYLISVDPSKHNANLLSQLSHTNEIQANQIVQAVLEDTSISLAEFVVNYLSFLRHYDMDTKLVFDKFATFYSTLVPVFNNSESFYQVPVVKTLSAELVELALEADKTGLKGKARKINEAARLLSKVFNIMLNDRSPIESSKIQGILYIANLVFKVYLKLNSITMFQTASKNISEKGLNLDTFPISEQVTYKYYIGRYNLYLGKLKEAQRCLLFAFERCHQQQWHNKRMILHYLIPTRIILGYFPSQQLLEKYQLSGQYTNLLTSLRVGNLQGYLNHIETCFDYFYKHLTYLLLKERGVTLVWRCLINNTYCQKQKLLGIASRGITFEDCRKAFALSHPNNQLYTTLDDMECILVSLISQGYIRGHIQHQKQVMVLSKTRAFPPISSVICYTAIYDELITDKHEELVLPDEIQQLLAN